MIWHTNRILRVFSWSGKPFNGLFMEWIKMPTHTFPILIIFIVCTVDCARFWSHERRSASKGQLLSIIVVTSNVNSETQPCLNSIQNQTYQEYDLIVIDGCSDRSTRLTKSLTTADESRMHNHEEDGLSHRIQQAIPRCKGQYTLVLTMQDTFSSINSLRYTISYLTKYQADLFCFQKKGTGKQNSTGVEQLRSLEAIINHCSSYLPNSLHLTRKIWRTTILQKVLASINSLCIHDEYCCFFYCLSQIQLCVAVPICLFSQGSHSGYSETGYISFRNKINYLASANNRATMMNRTEHRTERAVSLALISVALNELLLLEENEIALGWDILTGVFNSSEIIEQLWKGYRDRELLLAHALHTATSLQSSRRKVRTIGIYYLHYNQGGVQKVINLQLQLFVKMRYKVVFITDVRDPENEYPLADGVIRVCIPSSFHSNRASRFTEVLRDYRIDVVLYHAWNHLPLFYDLLLIKSQSIPVIIVRHGVLQQEILLKLRRTHMFPHIYRLADLVLVLSTSDEYYLKMFGVHAKYLANPIEFKSDSPENASESTMILWLGRLDSNKNYTAALTVMQKVLVQYPTARMVMLGREYDRNAAAQVQAYISRNNLTNSISYLGDVREVDKWYRQARIHLVTSATESFCMVIAESKSFGIPLVVFSLPYLELLKDRKGYIEVPQNNCDKAASAIVTLLKNKTLWMKLSKEAIESIEKFKQIDYRRIWTEIFRELYTPSNQYRLNPDIHVSELKSLFESIIYQHQRSFDPTITVDFTMQTFENKRTNRGHIKHILRALVILIISNICLRYCSK